MNITAVRNALWFAALTFPIAVIRLSPDGKNFFFRWKNAIIIAIAVFIISLIAQRTNQKSTAIKKNVGKNFLNNKAMLPAAVCGALFFLLYPFFAPMYHTNIMINALIYIMLALGLNIVTGLGGLLNLGYAGFYAIGAYTYALCHTYLGINFWAAIPIAAVFSAFAGWLLALPVLRLRGDYLAIVTLGFGEILRLFLENQSGFTGGAAGIGNIPKPVLPGKVLTLHGSIIFLYFLVIVLVVIVIIAVWRLEHSRLGRSWLALREDELASRSVGINTSRVKISAFSFGAAIAGIAGVIFAAKTTFISPVCFTFWESVIILCMVVLGGMGSIPGIIIASLVMSLTPEYLRVFSQYRMLVFGGVMVLMMLFKPSGIIPVIRRHAFFKDGTVTEKTEETAGQ